MRFHLAAYSLIAVAALVAGPVAASQPSGATTMTAAVAKADDDQKTERMECRRLVVSGSRMAKRVCGTKSDWEEKTRRDSQQLQNGQQQSDRRSFIDPKSLPK